MAIAKIRTLLSLDRYAQIMGINPLHFNGGNQINLAAGNILFPLDNAQNDIWPQYSWQNVDQVSREDLAMSLWNAENEIIKYVGFYPTPVWTEAERHDLNVHYRPEMQFMKLTKDVTGNDTSIKTDYGYFIRGGRRATTLIASRATVTYWDLDVDGWDEFGVVNCTVPAGVDPSEIKVYFAGRSADPNYEIRDFKSKALSGVTLSIGFESWKLVDPELYELYPTDDGTQAHIEMADASVFVVAVDVYREYNDETQDHVEFYAQSVQTSAITTQGGFLYQNTSKEFVMPVQATYNTTTGEWERQCATCVYPDYVDLWYYSGMRNRPGKHRYSDDYLPEDFATAIAYLATARLERVFYANNNATALATSLREYVTESERNGTFKMPTPDALTNPFGTRRGELAAWRKIFRYVTQRRAGGAL